MRRAGLFAVALIVVIGSLIGLPAPALAAGTLPCDIYAAAGTPCVAAHSTTRALYSAYNGNVYQVKRASDGATTNIGLLAAGGYANAAAQDTFCAGTSCIITIIYDQSPQHNDLTIEGPGAAGGQDVGANAAALPVTAGGHKVYGVYIAGQTGYRHHVGAGVAVNGQPEGMYMVASGTHVNGGCCFDYGNVEANIADTGNGHMDAVNLGTTCWAPPCTGIGPWVAGDLENGLYQGAGSNPANQGNATPWVTAMLKNNGQNHFALKGANAQTGGLTTWYDGAEPPNGYSPMHQEGSIVLGTGGDNSNASIGSFFEGVMTAGYPTDAADNSVQTNIVSVGYSGSTGASATGNTIIGPGDKCVDVAGDDNGGDLTFVQLWDCQSYAADQHWTHNADGSLCDARPLPRHRRQRYGERHQGRAVGLQRRRRPEVDPAVGRIAEEPAVRAMPGRPERQHRERHPAADLRLQRYGRAKVLGHRRRPDRRAGQQVRRCRGR